MIRYFQQFPNVLAIFTERNDPGYSSGKYNSFNLGLNTGDEIDLVIKNRKTLFKSLGIEQNSIVYGDQIHGNRVTSVNDPGIIPRCDALVTNKKGLSLVIQVADCACVFFYDPVKSVIALAHSGWRGTLADITTTTLKTMSKNYNSNYRDIHAIISPCISMEKLEIGDDLQRDFPKQFIKHKGNGKFLYNMKSHIWYQLEKNGLKNINISQYCTFKEKTRFFSYRRDKEFSGRMMGVITLK